VRHNTTGAPPDESRNAPPWRGAQRNALSRLTQGGNLALYTRAQCFGQQQLFCRAGRLELEGCRHRGLTHTPAQAPAGAFDASTRSCLGRDVHGTHKPSGLLWAGPSLSAHEYSKLTQAGAYLYHPIHPLLLLNYSLSSTTQDHTRECQHIGTQQRRCINLTDNADSKETETTTRKRANARPNSARGSAAIAAAACRQASAGTAQRGGIIRPAPDGKVGVC
jgi:hypothetical protein